MKRTLTISALATGLALGGVGIAFAGGAAAPNTAAEDRQEKAFTAEHRGDATVTEEQAVAAARERHAGTATDVHLENEDGTLVWEVKPDDGSTVWEVQVDATTGEVVGDQRDE